MELTTEEAEAAGNALDAMLGHSLDQNIDGSGALDGPSVHATQEEKNKNTIPIRVVSEVMPNLSGYAYVRGSSLMVEVPITHDTAMQLLRELIAGKKRPWLVSKESNA